MNEYFSHDYNARNEIKLKKLFMKQGLQGIGLYWCLIEMLYENDGYIFLERIPVIAFDLRIAENIIFDTIENYDLFIKNENSFYSNGVLKRIAMREEKSEIARIKANKRWQNQCHSNAIAMPQHNNSNASAENSNANKVKESKVNKIKERKVFTIPTFEEIQAYCIERKNNVDAKKFFDYFTASNWFDSKGNKVKSWKAKIVTWESYGNQVNNKPQMEVKMNANGGYDL